MITIEESRSGHRIIKCDGRVLASTFDPIKEAKTWVDQSVQLADARETLVILGLGAGYHVVELRSRRDRQPVLVIENRREIVSAACEVNPGLCEVDVVCETDWRKLVEHGSVRDAIGGTFRILKHGPSLRNEPEFYFGTERFLLGRDKESFLLQLKARPELCAMLDSDEILRMPDDAVSIKTVSRLFHESSIRFEERRIWKVLEELVL